MNFLRYCYCKSVTTIKISVKLCGQYIICIDFNKLNQTNTSYSTRPNYYHTSMLLQLRLLYIVHLY